MKRQIIAGLAAALLFTDGVGQSAMALQSVPASATQKAYTIKAGSYVASFEEDWVAIAVGHVATNNREAFQRLFEQKLAFFAKSGLKVRVIEKSKTWGDVELVRVLPLAGGKPFWTLKDALK